MAASSLETLATFLGVLIPLVGAPLTVIVFYLRSLREHQVSWHAEFIRRVEVVEASAGHLRETLREFERDYTTKEEWLRECMHARHILEQLRDATVRVETTFLAQSATGGETGRGRAESPGASPVGPFRCIRPMDGNEGVD